MSDSPTENRRKEAEPISSASQKDGTPQKTVSPPADTQKIEKNKSNNKNSDKRTKNKHPKNVQTPPVSRETYEKQRSDRKKAQKLAQKRRELSIPSMVFDEELPVSARREEIKTAIRKNQVVVLCGETGSGKSTQLPKICLELGFGVQRLIGHTQPRRIAATSIANRLAQEIAMGRQKPYTTLSNEKENDVLTLIPPEKLVGYKIRFTDHTSPETCIKLMTDGILLAETQGDRFLNQYEVLIIDEAHERSLNIDFLIGILRRLVDKRPDLKVIITSATIDAARFAAHFETETRKVPILQIEGRTYPVDVIYQPILEDDEDDEDDETASFIASQTGEKPKKSASVKMIHDGDIHQAVIRSAEDLAQKGPGDMLVFMPTERDIHELVKLLHGESERRRSSLFRNGNVEVLPLYARLPADQQQKIFNPSGNTRRIVLATNVAESSVTVPRIRYVIDTGTARISRYSARSKTQRLPIEPVSRASADQRKGRCGRIGPGICIRLYSEEDYKSREEYTQPEIQRTNLASVILQTKILKLGRIESFPFLDPPKLPAIRDGYKTLFELKALTHPAPDAELTPLGTQLARIPVDPRIGRMILEAINIAQEAVNPDVKTQNTQSTQNVKITQNSQGAQNTKNTQNAQNSRIKRPSESSKSEKKSPILENPLLEVLVIAAALEIRDPRERPLEKQGAADAAHAQFLHTQSDFLSLLKLWDFYNDLKEKLSRNQLLKACRQNFISWNRMREWIDVYHQLRELVLQLLKESKLPEKLLHGDTVRLAQDSSQVASAEEFTPKYTAIHRALLSGLLSNIGQKSLLTPEYSVGGGGKCFLWPGSGILKSGNETNAAVKYAKNARCAKISDTNSDTNPDAKNSGTNFHVNSNSNSSTNFNETSDAKTYGPKSGSKFWGRTLDAQGNIIDTHGNVNPDTNSSGPGLVENGTDGKDGADGKNAPRKKAAPAWVMGAEMVETSKRFLRTLAVIDSAWVEPLAEHLVTRTHSEPHWSKQNNGAMIYEKVSLSGLVIVPKRRVPYAQVNKEQAREMFLQAGLVEGNWISNVTFYRWNRELWFELEQIQAKLRRFDYLPGNWKLYEFYDARIPRDVYDGPSLEKWLRAVDAETLKGLEMTEEDLVNESADPSLAQKFPDTFNGEFQMPLRPVQTIKKGVQPISGGIERGDSSASQKKEKTEATLEKEGSENSDDAPVREIRLFGKVVQPMKTKKKTNSSSGDAKNTQLNKNTQASRNIENTQSEKNVENAKPARKILTEKTLKEAAIRTEAVRTSSYQFPLEYRFEPGSEEDGVTLHATLETVHQLQERALEWGVPGLLEERVAYLIKSLPKEQRRKLIPAPDTAHAVCGRIPFGVGNFRAVLAAEFTRIAGELIRERDLDSSKIPDALQINIRVCDTQGNLLVQSRDLHEVLRHVGEQASEKFAMVEDSRWTRGGFTSWNFGELPVQVQIESSLLDAASRAGKITAFPMLVDEGKTVGIRLSTSQFQAENNIRRAVMRLFRLAANRELNQHAIWMPFYNEMKMDAEHFVKTTRTPFADTICDLVAHLALNPEGFPALADMQSLLNRVPRNPQEYERLVKQAKGRISIVVQELPQSLAQLWKAYHAAIKALNSICTTGSQRHATNDLASRLTFGTLQIKSFGNLSSSQKKGVDSNQNSKNSQNSKNNSGSKNSFDSNKNLNHTENSDADGLTPSRIAIYDQFQPIVDDIDLQIQRLTPPDFLLQTSWKYVRNFARYFRGIEARIETLSNSNSGTQNALTRGMEQIRELDRFQKEYERLRRDNELRGVESDELEEFRWAIEEYRISLFAQKLGTSIPISSKRLEKMRDGLQ